MDQSSRLITFYSYNLATQVDTGRLEIVIILFRRGYLPIEINEINMDNKQEFITAFTQNILQFEFGLVLFLIKYFIC